MLIVEDLGNDTTEGTYKSYNGKKVMSLLGTSYPYIMQEDNYIH